MQIKPHKSHYTSIKMAQIFKNNIEVQLIYNVLISAVQ